MALRASKSDFTLKYFKRNPFQIQHATDSNTHDTHENVDLANIILIWNLSIDSAWNL